MTPARFQTFSSSVRPLRVAVLIDENDEEWQSSCVAIIEFFTQIWGGAHSIIVPTSGKSIDEEFWPLLSVHDPDLILTYAKTGEDIRRNHPERFERMLVKELEELEIHSGTHAPEKAKISAELSRVWLRNGFAISDALTKEMLTRLAPFAFQGKLDQHKVTAGGTPFYPLTSVADIVSEVEHPEHVVQIENDTSLPKLWLASTLGSASPQYLFGLNGKGIPSVPVTASQFSESDLIGCGIDPWGHFRGKSLFDISLLGLSTVRSMRVMPHELPTVLVVGDSLQDFCLFYALLRLHGRAVWIPHWFLEDVNGLYSRFMSALSRANDLARDDQADTNTLISSSVPVQDLERIAAEVKSIYSYTHLEALPLSTTFISSLVAYPLKVYVKGSIQNLNTYQLLGDELPGPFESPKPAALKTLNPQKHRWISEIEFVSHRIPRHPSLGKFIASHPNLPENAVRTSCDGLAYTCPGAFVSGTDPDFNLLRPSVRVPDARQLALPSRRSLISKCLL